MATDNVKEGFIYFEKSITKNMGDYNSAKVTIGTTLPINFTKEDVALAQKAIRKADKLVTDELSEQLEEMLS